MLYVCHVAGQNDGEDITAYKSPSSSSNNSTDELPPQRLVYALFEQPSKNITTDSLNSNNIEKDLKQFVKDNNLVLVNAAYIYTQSPEAAAIVERFQRIATTFKEEGLLDSLVGTLDNLLGEVENILGLNLGLGSKKSRKPKKPTTNKKSGTKVVEEDDDDEGFGQDSVEMDEQKADLLERVERIADTFDVTGLVDSVLDTVKQLLGEIEDLIGVGAGTGKNKNNTKGGLMGLSEEPVQALPRNEMTLQNQRAVMTDRLQRIAQAVDRAGLLQPVLDLVSNLLGEVEGILGLGSGRRNNDDDDEDDDEEGGGGLLSGLLGILNKDQPAKAQDAAADAKTVAAQEQTSIIIGRLQRIAAAANEVGLLDPVLDAVKSLLEEIGEVLGLNLDMGDVKRPSGPGQDSEVIVNHPRNFRRHARF